MKNLIGHSPVILLIIGTITLIIAIEAQSYSNAPYLIGFSLLVLGFLGYIFVNRIMD